MPTYEYKCGHCGHEFERFQSINAGPVRKCPSCGQNGVKRLIGLGAGVIFKGSGFYETDYRSESYRKAAEKETKSETKTADDKGATKTADKAKTEVKDKKKTA